MAQTFWNPWLIFSAVLAIGLALFHSILGERYLVRRLLRRENLPKLFGDDSFTKLTIRYAWHLLTIACFGLAAVRLWAARPGTSSDEPEAARIVAITLLLAGVWGMVATRGRHLSWIVLLAAGGLAWYGAMA